MHRRGGTGEIINLIDFEIERKGDIVADELEMLVVEQIFDVGSCAGKKIVDTYDLRALRQQRFAQMRAEKAGAAGDQDALLQMHETATPVGTS